MPVQAVDAGWARLFKTAFDRSQNAMVLSDDRRHVVEVNRACCRLVGYRRSQLLGRPLWELVVDGPVMTPGEWRVAIAQEELVAEAELRRADGTAVMVQVAMHPEVMTGQNLVLFVALTVSRWGRHFRRGNGAD